MKKITSVILILGIIIFTAFSCESDNNSISVNFKLRLLNEQGKETKIFNEGENIIFSFLIINNSSEDLFLENFLPNDDFFRVYKLSETEANVDYGIPYGAVLEINGYQINAKDTLEIKYGWKESENIPNSSYFITYHIETNELPKGSYISTFSSSFNIGNLNINEKKIEIEFEII
jgi:hypothetical protein